MKKILVVDESPTVLREVSEILKDKYAVVCASSGEEALELCRRERPDMLLCDISMEAMDGPELQRRMTELHGQSVPFMFMSDEQDRANESLGLEAGAMDYIAKPCKPEVLIRRVENIMRQIDSLRQIQGLKVVVQTDTMTGLLNKAFAQKELTELCTRSNGVMMMLDLDNFKLVNDIYGHDMGDRVLIRFAEILRSVVRSSDLVGRMGGDEFIAFCRDIRSERLILRKAEMINAALLASAKELMGDDMSIPIGVSVGAVFVPDEGTDFDELYRKADKALYSVKENGKHGCEFFHERAAHAADTTQRESSAVLESAHKILEERNRQKGAYEVGLESFRTLYRFFTRVMENYHYDAELVVFTFPADTDGNVVEAFGMQLRDTLRRSDVFTKSGDCRYMVLLPQPIPDHGVVAIRRVLARWGERNIGIEPAYEHESIAVEA